MKRSTTIWPFFWGLALTLTHCLGAEKSTANVLRLEADLQIEHSASNQYFRVRFADQTPYSENTTFHIGGLLVADNALYFLASENKDTTKVELDYREFRSLAAEYKGLIGQLLLRTDSTLVVIEIHEFSTEHKTLKRLFELLNSKIVSARAATQAKP